MSDKKSLPPILYVDDEEDNLVVFKSTFRRDYEIHLAKSGMEGLEIMKKHPIQVIITDQRMPEMTGIQFLQKVIPDYPDCIRMILTGFSDIEAIIQAINTGRVYRYITKPWSREELKINIDKGLETYHLREQNRKLIDNLREANLTLEQRVIERTRMIEAQKSEITSSIQYASRIQNALLPREEEFNRHFQSFFILSKPKDIVSGDFYWLGVKDDKIVIAVADCTGHGVPGAFMSLLGVSFLNEIHNKSLTIRANEILNQLRDHVIKSLHQTGRNKEARDGMEIALCVIDKVKWKLQFSGAFRPLYILRKGEIHEMNGDNMPIGLYEEEDISFTNKEMQFEKDDMIYLFTDGYIDQMGGESRKTYKSQNFKKLLLSIHNNSMTEQKEILEKNYNDWRGMNDQIDDILIVGIKM
ncbi:MAG: SpoIIE family protein phosphatase [Bacteroidia bacterium]|nr:SpoIIE family protein phosphatase [Bacteroidia bacterium]